MPYFLLFLVQMLFENKYFSNQHRTFIVETHWLAMWMEKASISNEFWVIIVRGTPLSRVSDAFETI